MWPIYLKGLLISLALVCSIGVQNIFVFNNAIANKLSRSILFASFIWIADTALTVIAFLGMGAIISTHPVFKIIVMAVGGLMVIWIGYGIIKSAASFKFDLAQNQLTTKRAFIMSWIVTWANPQALIDTSLMLGAFRSTLTEAQVLPFMLGIVSATALWFFGITLVLNLLKDKLPNQVLVAINVISGLIVMGYGFYLGWNVLHFLFF